MSIRAIAQELYKCQAKVHQLEDQLNLAESFSEKEKLKKDIEEYAGRPKVAGRNTWEKFPAPFLILSAVLLFLRFDCCSRRIHQYS